VEFVESFDDHFYFLFCAPFEFDFESRSARAPSLEAMIVATVQKLLFDNDINSDQLRKMVDQKRSYVSV